MSEEKHNAEPYLRTLTNGLLKRRATRNSRYGNRCHNPKCEREFQVGEEVVAKPKSRGGTAYYCKSCAKALNILVGNVGRFKFNWWGGRCYRCGFPVITHAHVKETWCPNCHRRFCVYMPSKPIGTRIEKFFVCKYEAMLWREVERKKYQDRLEKIKQEEEKKKRFQLEHSTIFVVCDLCRKRYDISNGMLKDVMMACSICGENTYVYEVKKG